jgi:hypothetical protein
MAVGDRDSLRAFADGRFDAWRGLRPWTRAQVESAVGRGHADIPHLAAFQQWYATGAHAPYGMKVESRDERAVWVEIPSPVMTPEGLVALLGEPEAKARSRYGRTIEQWVYASRGVTAHVRRVRLLDDPAVVVVIGYPPTTVERFLASDDALFGGAGCDGFDYRVPPLLLSVPRSSDEE